MQIVGGLGNQLFTFFAAYNYALNFSKELIVNTSEISLKTFNHKSNIRSFEFIKNFKISLPRKKSVLQKFIEALCRRSTFLNSIYFNVSGIYCSPKTGYDEILNSNRNIIVINGYFQSFKYLENLLHRGKFLDLILTQRSVWFETLSKEILSKQVVALHVRRGDYSQVQSSLGILTRDYYKTAITYFQEELPQSELWVFSDDVFLAKTLLGGILKDGTTWIEPPSNADPAESLVLMSYAKGLIIANSTFSWWAAATGNLEKKVVAPIPWFKNSLEPDLLIPANWHRIESSWE